MFPKRHEKSIFQKVFGNGFCRISLCSALVCGGSYLLGQEPVVPRTTEGPGVNARAVQQPAQTNGVSQPLPPSAVFPDGIPSLETMIQQAINNHPDVMVARGKVRAAEAELRVAELKALREVTQVRRDYQKFAMAIKESRGGSIELLDLQSAWAAAEWELAFLIGMQNGTGVITSTSPGGGGGGGSSGIRADHVQNNSNNDDLREEALTIVNAILPEQETIAKIKSKLDQKTEISCEQYSLQDFAAYLTDLTQVRFILDKVSLDENSIPADATEINLDLGMAPIGSAILALEDLKPDIQFIVRDYGVLVCAKSLPDEKVVIRLRDLWKLSPEKLQSKAQRQVEYLLNGGIKPE